MTVKGIEAPWTIIDSGANSHTVGGRELLSGALSIAHLRVVLGDRRSVLADISGSALVSSATRSAKGKSFELKDVHPTTVSSLRPVINVRRDLTLSRLI